MKLYLALILMFALSIQTFGQRGVTFTNICARYDRLNKSVVFISDAMENDKLVFPGSELPTFKGISSFKNYTIVGYSVGWVTSNSFYDVHLKNWDDMPRDYFEAFKKTNKFFLDNIKAVDEKGDTIYFKPVTCTVNIRL
jgi:hypothetical protein